ncbi:MAG TPA: hypothetical protein VGX21_09090 [Methylomirabilota bacterium]|jgi:hypothetical protein|nr:hypothetical protein [Methylomirabilota bacterium]
MRNNVVERLLIGLAVTNLLILLGDILFNVARALSPPFPFR